MQEIPPEFNGLGSGLVSFTTAFLDIDEDGRLDRLTGHGGAPLEAYIQRSGGDFEHPEGAAHTTIPDGLWMGLAAADFDRDEELEFYALLKQIGINDKSVQVNKIEKNYLFLFHQIKENQMG